MGSLHHTLRRLLSESQLNNTQASPYVKFSDCNSSRAAAQDHHSYIYVVFILLLFAAIVAGMVLGYTRVKKVDEGQDPYQIYKQRMVPENV